MCASVNNFFDSDKVKSYQDNWASGEVSDIMLFSDIPQQLDSLAMIPTDEARFEMGRLCFSLGLYRQAQDYFRQIPDSEIKSIFMAQIKMILNEYDSTLVYLSMVDDTSFGGMALLCLNQISRIKPELVEGMEISDDFSGFLHYFVEKESSVSEPAHLPGLFTIQFGAFRSEERAKALAEKVGLEGIRVQINKREVEGEVLFLVQGGSFTSREQAESRASQLSENLVYYIVEIR